MKEKRSFFERLTGSIDVDDEYDVEEEEVVMERAPEKRGKIEQSSWNETDGDEGQLAVDVYQTPREIIVKTMVAGVKREDLDISLTRDMITIKGRREEDRGISESDYFHKELYWGTFSRTILLPHEVEVEGGEAVENQGLLIIKIPKVDKERQSKMKVKAA